MKRISSYLLGGISLLGILACNQENKPKALFTVVSHQNSGINFENRLFENDSINIIDNEFVYNGGGVALGDFNNDGLEDLFFAGNQMDNALYLNEGSLKFRDITVEAAAGKPDSLYWSSGVNIIDVNRDGNLDIYICNTFYRNPELRKNLLYIHQGLDEEGIPSFKEAAMEYGVADTTYSSHAQFFDYDQDGDLDLFIGVNRIEGINPSEFRPQQDDGSSLSRDKLYRNDWNDSLGHPVFVDVSDIAGIKYHGYSHSTLINDFNGDGWADIYVANDFFSNDLIYINNQDGTFTNQAGDYFKHFSLSSMGSDLVDLNADGEMDFFTTEMQPYYNKRKKLFQGPSSYQKEIFTRTYDYEYQYARNTLQISNGVHPQTGLPLFSEAGMFAGVQETDWSWAPLFADFDNDGLTDLYITNGFPKDVTDRDFGDFRATASRFISKEKLIAAIPEIKLPNFMFKNNGDLTFEDVTRAWGLDYGSFSNGAAYGDLDNDGDLDLVVNNINDKASLLENTTNSAHPERNYLRVKLQGVEENKAAFGAVVKLYQGESVQQQALLSARGYLSKTESTLHFGLGDNPIIDSLKIQWPDNSLQRILQPNPNQVLKIAYGSIAEVQSEALLSRSSLLKRLDSTRGLQPKVPDLDFIDFNFQRTLPHKFSQYGPSLAAGDVNGDGRSDIFIGGSRSFPEMWLIQEADGTFAQKEVNYKKHPKLEEEDTGTLLFDADGDGDLDLYLGRGSAQYPRGDTRYQDVLLINDGNGNFGIAEDALPYLTTNTSAVKAADFDRDGDLDLFIGSRVQPFAYPLADNSYFLRNESKAGVVKFVNATNEVNPVLTEAGLISDALWTDFNGDSWPDLILAAEWSPLRFFENQQGQLKEITETTGVGSDSGWWNSLVAADLDNDGDMDYVAGNAGKNGYFKGTKAEPLRIYAKDLDDNGMVDPLISYYLRDSVGVRKEYLYHPWQDVVKQYAEIRKRFNSFGEFGNSTLPEMFPDGLLEDAEVKEFNTHQTSWFENLGNNTFKRHALPMAAQLAPIYGILAEDIDADGWVDLLLVGNDYGMEVQQGRADAFMGGFLKNTGGSFKSEEAGFYVPGDAKALISLQGGPGETIYLASQNNDILLGFSGRNHSYLNIKPNEVKAVLTLGDGSTQLREFYYGSGFNSQSERTLRLPPGCTLVEFYGPEGQTRTVQPIAL